MQNYLQQPQYARPMFYKALPIANEAEMNNYTVDFNGMPTYFHNQATNEIFVRQFDFRTGLTTTQKFIKSEPSSTPVNESKEENNRDLYKADFEALNGRLNGLEKMIENLNKKDDIKGVKNAK
jgi:hypothetical protein